MAVEICEGLRLVVADNPSPLTGRGTNSWLLGTDRVVVIDPGPELEDHLAALLAAVRGAVVEAVIVTHAHRDHAGLARRFATVTGAPVLGFGPLPSWPGPATGEDAVVRDLVPDMRLGDQDLWRGGAGALRALHTPGHLGDHLCLCWEGVVFSGDHVMGWASTVIAPPEGDMGAYMASLDRLEAEGAARLYPGHGAPVEEPAARIAALRAHRLAREGEILAELARGPARIGDLVTRLYAAVPVALHPAAVQNVLAHLLDLEAKSWVVAEPGLGRDALWRLR
jgi:glyoxylase-like metal-dependent hydrolase (beta-lactamase superfamily II)